MSRISIHALHEESDGNVGSLLYNAGKFQSTLSMRRATLKSRPFFSSVMLFQSTLSMRRATVPEPLTQITLKAFQSTLSMRRATFPAPTFWLGGKYFNPRSP